MGKYDQFLAGLPSSGGGKYSEFTKDLTSGPTNAETIEPGIYGDTDPAGQRILENLGAVAGGYGVGKLATTGIIKAAESNIGKALLNSPKDLGKQYAAQDAAVGVTRTLPETGPRAVFEDPYKYPSELSKPKYADVKSSQPQIVNPQGKVISPNPASSIEPVDAAPTSFSRPKPTLPAEQLPTTIPQKLPGKLAGFKNFAESRMNDFGEKLTPQELMNYKVHLQTIMNDGSVPKFDSQTGKITTAYQQASDLQNKVSGLFQKIMDSKLQGADLPEGVIDTRSGLDKINALSNNIRRIPGKALAAGKTVAKFGALTAALGYGANKVLGGE